MKSKKSIEKVKEIRNELKEVHFGLLQYDGKAKPYVHWQKRNILIDQSPKDDER